METNNFLSRKFIFAKILMKINEHWTEWNDRFFFDGFEGFF